jgi:hypothetical protein
MIRYSKVATPLSTTRHCLWCNQYFGCSGRQIYTPHIVPLRDDPFQIQIPNTKCQTKIEQPRYPKSPYPPLLWMKSWPQNHHEASVAVNSLVGFSLAKRTSNLQVQVPPTNTEQSRSRSITALRKLITPRLKSDGKCCQINLYFYLWWSNKRLIFDQPPWVHEPLHTKKCP